MAKQPKTLTHEEVAALAESVGLPGEAFAQIAKGESGYQIGATGHDPGGTTGLGLWQITTKFNDDIIAKFGGAQRLLTDPLANAKAAKAIFDRQGIKAWYGTKYLTDPNAHYKGSSSAPSAPVRTQPEASTTPATDGGADAASARRAALQQYVLNADRDPNAALNLAEGLSAARQLKTATPAVDARTALQARRTTPKADAGGVIPLGGSKNAGKGAFDIDGPDPGRLQPGLTSFAKKVASVFGGTLVGKDGSSHSKYTVNGNVSDHYSGNATDIFSIGGQPAQGAVLLKAGRAALIAAGMPREQALKAQGGLYNVNGHQIIFSAKGDAVGGDHTDHLHISAR